MNDNLQKECPYCAESIRAQAVKCRHCGSHLNDMRHPIQWYRDTKNGKIAGVCAGLATELGLPLTILRLFLIASIFIGGWGLIIYGILWIIMPEYEDIKQEATQSQKTSPKDNEDSGIQATIIGRN